MKRLLTALALIPVVTYVILWANYWVFLSVLTLVAVLCFSLASFAQAPAPTDAKSANEAIYSGKHHEGAVPPHDLSGVWMVSENFRFSPIHEPPSSFLQPWALAKLNAEPMALRKDLPAGHAGGTTALGKDEDIKCSQISLTDFIIKQKPIEIVQTPQRIFMFFEYSHTFREIWMDGRSHPSDLPPTYMGHSTGKWEGETLVVDTTGFNDKTWLDRVGHRHSEDLHVIERFHRVDHDTLRDDITVEDPKALTMPWNTHVIFALRPGWEILEYSCADNANFDENLQMQGQGK